MVLGAQAYPVAGGHQGYLHEGYRQQDQHNHGAIYKDDYYSKDGFYRNSPGIHTGPNPSYHSSHGLGHQGYGGQHGHYIPSSGGYRGGYDNLPVPGNNGYHNLPVPGNNGYGGYPNHQVPGNSGYGTHYGYHVPAGSNWSESRYGHSHSASAGPYYGQHKTSSWISKDLDD